jgi:hypothetical protein
MSLLEGNDDDDEGDDEEEDDEEENDGRYGVLGHDDDVVLHVGPQTHVPGGAGGEGRHPLAGGLVRLGPNAFGELGQFLCCARAVQM